MATTPAGRVEDVCGEEEREEERVEERLDTVLREFGLSEFSLRMARQWLSRIFEDPPSAPTSAPASVSAEGETQGQSDTAKECLASGEASGEASGPEQADVGATVGVGFKRRDAYARVRGFLRSLVNRRRPARMFSVHQLGCPELVPGLAARPFWTAADAPSELGWVADLAALFPVIRAEVLALAEHGASGFQPYRAPAWSDGARSLPDGSTAGSERGDWNVFYLFLHNVPFEANRARCPRTCAFLESVPGFYEHAMFSVLAPGAHVTPHTGPTNKKLRCHLPLVVPPGDAGCRLRVGDEVHVFREGEVVIFDDSFEHEAWNDAAEPRIVLLFDIWHPELSGEEVKFLSFLRSAKLRLAKKVSEAGMLEAKDDFFRVLESAAAAGVVDAAAVFGSAATTTSRDGLCEGKREAAAAGGGAQGAEAGGGLSAPEDGVEKEP